ncbi:MAG: hypothetical protein RLZZ169_528, partial [Pseudomonadota bacterium]
MAHATHPGDEGAVGVKIHPAKTGIATIQCEVCMPWMELHTGGGGTEIGHGTSHGAQLVMDMAEEHEFHPGMTVQNRKEVLWILQGVTLQPGSSNRDRIMVQADQHMLCPTVAQRGIQ